MFLKRMYVCSKMKLSQTIEKKRKKESNMDYKRMIIELIEETGNEKLIEYLYGLVKSLIKKWG